MSSIALIDCEDSFTNNIYDYLRQVDASVDIILHSQCVVETLNNYDGIVLSPGPNSPEDIPLLFSIIDTFQGTKPILGICLGHQAIGMYYGHKLKKSTQPMHGIPTKIIVEKDEVFDQINIDHFEVMRYNSLCIEDYENSPLKVIARDVDGEIMGFKHKDFPIYSFQFHPESVGTPQGMILLRNWGKTI